MTKLGSFALDGREISLSANDETLADPDQHGNDQVAVGVDSGEQIGDRELVNEACTGNQETSSSTFACADDGISEPPRPPSLECDVPDTSARDLYMALGQNLLPQPPSLSERFGGIGPTASIVRSSSVASASSGAPPSMSQ